MESSRIDSIARDESPALALELVLAEETRLRKYTERVLDSRQVEIEELEIRNAKLADELLSAKERLGAAELELEQSRRGASPRRHAMRPSLQSNGIRRDITEPEAVSRYQNLVVSVQKWASKHSAHTLDDIDASRLRQHSAPISAWRFTSMLRESGRRSLGVGKSDKYHVVAVIMVFLCSNLFLRPFWSPLDDSDADATSMWIDELEEAMVKLPRSHVQCREWRAETLTALVSQPAFKPRRARYLGGLSEDLAELLSVIAPRTPNAELYTSLREAVIDPAASLAHRLHLSANIYTMKWPVRHASSRLRVYDCIDIATGEKTKASTGKDSDTVGRDSMSYLFDIAPGLFVERFDGDKKLKPKAICKPRVLVQADNDQVASEPTFMEWLWESSVPPAEAGNYALTRTSPRVMMFPPGIML